MRYIRYAFLLFLVIAGVIFAVMNSYAVKIYYYIGSISVYMPLLLLFAMVLGAIISLILVLPLFIRYKTVQYKLNNKIKKNKKELDNLRFMPILDNDK